MNLTIANVSTSIDDPTFANAVAAIALQVTRDFQPEWGSAATLSGTRLVLGASRAPINTSTDAIIYLGDSSQDPTTGAQGMYGYHSDNYNHLPYGFVYLDVCAEYGEIWSCTLSHEVLELLADPTAVLAVTGPAPPTSGTAGGSVYYELEVCDPTQGDAYLINDVAVSNFVSKSYFRMAGGAQTTNFLNLVLSPLGVRPGGYLQYQDAAGTHQIDGSKVDDKRRLARKILAGYRRNSRREGRFMGQPVNLA
jgi:hypothetical protein